MRSNNRIAKHYFVELEKRCQTGLAKHSTFFQRKRAVNYFIHFLNESSINLKKLNVVNVQDFLQFLSEKKAPSGQSFAPATIKQIYALVRSFYRRCYEREIVVKHPDLIFTKDLLQQYKFGEQKLPKYINQERMKNLLVECPDRWKALLYFMYETGARIGEVLNVHHQHVDFKRNVVQIFQPKTRSFRVTSLSPQTVTLLQEYMENYRPTPRENYEQYLFINQQRYKMTNRAVQYLINRLSTRILGANNAITPHYFRAACAVHLLESGVDIRQVQEIIGWKSLTVVQSYTRITPQRQAELKAKHHPSFRMKDPQPIQQNIGQPSEMVAFQKQLDTLTRNLEEERIIRQKEREERQKERQKELLDRQKERKDYEQRIDELIKTQQQMLKLLAHKD